MLTPTKDKLVPAGSSAPEILDLAERRLSQSARRSCAAPPSLLPAFLPVATTDLYLAAARAGRQQVMQWRRQWRIWRAAKSGV